MAKLDWLVVADWFQTETSLFWAAPDMKAEDVKTEVYFLPAALLYEKIGSINNSGRWIQWREKAVELPGECRNDFEMMMLIWDKLRALYEKEGGACPDQILKANFNYRIDGKPDLRAFAGPLTATPSRTGNSSRATADCRLTAPRPAASGFSRATTTTKPTRWIP